MQEEDTKTAHSMLQVGERRHRLSSRSRCCPANNCCLCLRQCRGKIERRHRLPSRSRCQQQLMPLLAVLQPNELPNPVWPLRPWQHTPRAWSHSHQHSLPHLSSLPLSSCLFSFRRHTPRHTPAAHPAHGLITPPSAHPALPAPSSHSSLGPHRTKLMGMLNPVSSFAEQKLEDTVNKTRFCLT